MADSEQVLGEQAAKIDAEVRRQMLLALRQGSADFGYLIGPGVLHEGDPRASVAIGSKFGSGSPFQRPQPGGRTEGGDRYVWVLDQVPAEVIDSTLKSLGQRETSDRPARLIVAEALVFNAIGTQFLASYQGLRDADAIPNISAYEQQQYEDESRQVPPLDQTASDGYDFPDLLEGSVNRVQTSFDAALRIAVNRPLAINELDR